MTSFKCIESLEENTTEVFLQVSSILLKLIDNILLYPSNPKYRKLRLENKLVSTILMPSIGAMECLFEIGFQEDDDALLLPPESTPTEKLSRFRTEISNRRNKYLTNDEKKPAVGTSHSQTTTRQERQSTPQPEAASKNRSSAGTSPINANLFLANLHRMSSMVLQYEQDSTKRKALSVVPLSSISERVQSRMRLHQHQALKDEQSINEASLQETIFFTELMTWFKNDFFEWVNSPQCPNCNCETQFLEMSNNPQEKIQSERVEVYKCGNCSVRVLFPRINEAVILFDTKKGRCGEWANAFTAICRALGWDARYVFDETDHVWTEVFFRSEGRWVHCDPCECVLDTPLLYEKGWGKHLSYVIGFSCDNVQDVTWRYSANHKAVLARRKHCSELQLVQTLQQLNQLRQANLSVQRRKALARRTVLELVTLMVPASNTAGDSQGRQSGSLAWRLARCETSLPQTTYTWTPTSQEVEVERMVISYCTAKDEYKREITGETTNGWATRAFAAENVFRKEERDWKNAYLCRTEHSEEGKLSWRVDFSDSGLSLSQVEVRCPSATYHSGTVNWVLCSGEKCLKINNGHLQTDELRGSQDVTLTVTLSGGEGEVAWQHAQLFRQPLEASEPAFYLCFTFYKS